MTKQAKTDTGGGSTASSTARSTRDSSRDSISPSVRIPTGARRRYSSRSWTKAENEIILNHIKNNDDLNEVSTIVFVEKLQATKFPNRTISALNAKLWRERKNLKNEQ